MADPSPTALEDSLREQLDTLEKEAGMVSCRGTLVSSHVVCTPRMCPSSHVFGLDFSSQVSSFSLVSFFMVFIVYCL